MTSLYTSYETSVALKEAGADPHGLPGKHSWWWFARASKTWVLEPVSVPFPGSIRAWRLDEILAALHGHLWQIGEADNLDYVCGAYTQAGAGGEWVSAASPPALPWSPVEAAAACWLSVLKGGRAEEPTK